MASKMTGADAVAKALREIGGASLTPAINAASKKALKPTLVAAKANAPVDDGDLKRSLVMRRDSKAPKGTVRHVVGPSKKFTGKDGARPVKYAHVVEFGSADGTKRATRFLTRAHEATKGEVVDQFGKEIGPAIEARARKVAAKRAKS